MHGFVSEVYKHSMDAIIYILLYTLMINTELIADSSIIHKTGSVPSSKVLFAFHSAVLDGDGEHNARGVGGELGES